MTVKRHLGPYRPFNFKDISGMRFARLTAVEYIPAPTGKGRWKCLCDCGGVAYTTHADLRRGHTTSCGCAHKRPASIKQRNKALYLVWQEMKARCERPTHCQFRLYGKKGVKICERWQTFENFLADMGPRPDGMSIDRIDSDGNYEPSNCRWATATEQARNTNRNRYLELHGERKAMSEWCLLFGIKRTTLVTRLSLGWSVEEALTTGIRPWPAPKGMQPSYRSTDVLTPEEAKRISGGKA